MNVFYKQQHSNFIWFYQGFYWQYGCYILITFVGLFIFKKVNTERVLYGVLTSTIIFFLLTNFGCFPGNHLYTQNYRGLIACYVAGIPFIKGTLLGDLFYSTLLFGSFALLQHRFTILKPVIQNK